MVDVMWNTSGHLLCPSTTIGNKAFLKGPTKLICKRYHGVCDLSHGCTGAAVGWCCVARLPEHARQFSSRSLSIFGHHIYDRPCDFICIIPRCTVWISSITCARSDLGITTRFPNKMHPWCTVSSSSVWYKAPQFHLPHSEIRHS